MDEILTLLNSYSRLGEKRLDDGTLLIGRAPHIAPLAWLHTVYPALTDSQIRKLEKRLDTQIPPSYKDFLLITNGLNVFNTVFCLYGLRKNYIRTVDNVWQPFDIITPNVEERIYDSKHTDFFIGGYNWDGSRLYIDGSDGSVHRCSSRSRRSLNKWNSFLEMLSSEVHRLATLFDLDGKEINESVPTVPS
jgi:hypothetical protein